MTKNQQTTDMEEDIKTYEYTTVIVEAGDEDAIEHYNLTQLHKHFAEGWEPILVAPQSVSIANKYSAVKYAPVLYTLRKIKITL